jgi:methylglutaconyl-CoA hydratase
MLRIEIQSPVATLILNRPEVHNALNDELMALLARAFEDLGADGRVRVIVLRAHGPSFCSGGDLNWMKRAAAYTQDANLHDVRAGASVFLAATRCPKPIIARVHAKALGGGAGLVAACDTSVAVESAEFGFPEAKIGLLPGIVGPFLIARIGMGNAREYFLTGERFTAARAKEIGLIQHVVRDEPAMDHLIEGKIRELLTSSPASISAAKEFIFKIAGRPIESTLEAGAQALADARTSADGRAGVEAFLTRTKPPWIPQ